MLAAVFWPIYPGYGGRHAYVLAENLVNAGYQVDAVTAFPIDLRRRWNFFRQKPISRETDKGIRILRVFAFLPTGPGLLQKLMFYLSFMGTSLWAIPFIRRTDYVLGLHPPPVFLIFPGWVFSRLMGAKYIIRITDLWPDVVFEFKLARRMPLRQGVILLTKMTYGLADHIMAFTPQIRDKMLERGVPARKLSVVEMAVDTVTFRPASVSHEEREAMGLVGAKGKFIVLYSGAFALTYDFDLLLQAAKKLEKERVAFVLLGDGDARSHILETVRKLELKNVIMAQPVSKPEKVAKYINAADACVMPLKPEMLTSTLTRPSKVFEFWACGKPVVSCTKGEMESLTNESGAGMVVGLGDVEGFTEAIRHLYRNPETAREMGKRGREFAETRFSLESLKASLAEAFGKLDSQ
ncbi:MAG: glycosyltransferase family 4 protein [Chloroflexi bacterium]|nr:glycosyltransferase family 4 protein [Chloroflexota bacterium]